MAAGSATQTARALSVASSLHAAFLFSGAAASFGSPQAHAGTTIKASAMTGIRAKIARNARGMRGRVSATAKSGSRASVDPEWTSGWSIGNHLKGGSIRKPINSEVMVDREDLPDRSAFGGGH
jgi:hypothetical protein